MTTPAPQKRPAYEPVARLLQPTGYNPAMRRPITTVAGVALVLLRVLVGALVLASIAAAWGPLVRSADPGIDAPASDAALWLVLGIGAFFLALDAVFAVLILRGHNWPRILVMLISTISIASAFIAWWAVGDEITLDGTFPSLSLDILVLLALSSRSAAAYARRNERP